MRDVSQISPPLRIVLVAAVAFLAAYMFVLKPHGDSGTKPTPAASSASTPTAPGVKGLTRAVDKAKQASKTSDATNAKIQQATGGGQAATSPSVQAAKQAVQARKSGQPASKSASDLADLPLPVLSAVAQNKVMVLLFFNPKSADDRAVKRAVAKVDRWGGQVFVRSAPISTISAYGRITRGADVEQSPTVVVVDRKLRATRLVGYVDAETIDQAIVDALRNSGVLIKSGYLHKVNQLCMQSGFVASSADLPGKPAEVSTYLNGQSGVISRFEKRFSAIPAPARFRAFKRGTSADVKAFAANLSGWGAALGKHPTPAAAAASIQRFVPRGDAIAQRLNHRMDANHVLACGSQS